MITISMTGEVYAAIKATLLKGAKAEPARQAIGGSKG
jgi:hypothetical protein